MATTVVSTEIISEFSADLFVLREAYNGSPNAGGGVGFGMSIVCDGTPIFTFGSGVGGGIRQVLLDSVN